MAAKRISKTAPAPRTKTRAANPKNLLLMLSLLPLAAGVLLVLAWAADIIVWGSDQFQVSISVLLILISFALSNTVQKNWILAAGWTLLVVADALLVFWIDFNLQIVAFIIGGLGLICLGYEFVRRFRAQSKSKQNTKQNTNQKR
jgi:hypothetical protein